MNKPRITVMPVCNTCGGSARQLIRHITYQEHYYRIVRCLVCGSVSIEPLNPNRNPPHLSICGNYDINTRSCKMNGEPCGGIIEGELITGRNRHKRSHSKES